MSEIEIEITFAVVKNGFEILRVYDMCANNRTSTRDPKCECDIRIQDTASSCIFSGKEREANVI